MTRTHPDLGIIVLSMHHEEGYVFQAIRAGARGYLSKNVRAEELIRAIRQVASGASVLDPQMTRRVLSEFNRLASQSQETAGIGGLNDSEIQVLRLIASGLSNRQIANKLGFAESTVKNKLSVIFEKINVEDRTQAAIFAITNGLLPETKAEV
ncbi:MAG TPA: response regulator transcription factor [Dehalococcoidia bacterium]|nr:response regulator transcription factor [Dehalococcoidia bacterium]